MTVSGRPVFVLEGAQPSFRDLGPGIGGSDVRQLESALVRLGLDPGPRDGLFDDATALAVEAWYRQHGFEAVRATESQLSDIRSLEADLLPQSRAGPGVQIPADELLFVPQTPVRVSELAIELGDQLDGSVMTVTNTVVAIDSALPLDEASLVTPGMAVSIDEADLGINTTGVVSQVADAPGTNDVDGSHIYYEV
ncbi:MAG: peptidoglycan-binding protein, partial [Actinomycetia bacterium]|nr:peptidoglycan-binding protein [Actinomycetes bacterium]